MRDKVVRQLRALARRSYIDDMYGDSPGWCTVFMQHREPNGGERTSYPRVSPSLGNAMLTLSRG